MSDDTDEIGGNAEVAKLFGWRVECLIRWGADVYWAGRWAIHDNWRDAEGLLKSGCPQPLIDQIL